MSMFAEHQAEEAAAAVNVEDEAKTHLEAELEVAKQKRRFYQITAKAVPAMGVVIFIICLIVYFSEEASRNTFWLIFGIIYLAVSICFPLLKIGSNADIEIEAIENELLLATTGTDAVEQRAERLFKNHELELRRYYGQALKHNALIFYAGVLCVLLGFAVVFSVVYFVFINPQIDGETDKILAASLGAISGVLSNFVAATFIKMFSQVSQSLNTFHERLVRTNHLYFSSFLLSKISDVKERERILGLLALQSVETEGEEK